MSATHPSLHSNGPHGAMYSSRPRSSTVPVSEAAVMERSARPMIVSYIETSMNWPRPLRVRSKSASMIA